MKMKIRFAWLAALVFMTAGAIAAPPDVKDLDGKTHRPTEVKGKAAVIVFLMHDCPISNAYAPELKRIGEWAKEKGVPFYLVYADLDVELAALKKHAMEYGYADAPLVDPKRVLARHVGATVAPQAFVLGADGKVKFQGRVDDRYADFGKQRPAPTKRDLKDAVEAVLSGRPVAEPKTPAIGCSIE